MEGLSHYYRLYTAGKGLTSLLSKTARMRYDGKSRLLQKIRIKEEFKTVQSVSTNCFFKEKCHEIFASVFFS